MVPCLINAIDRLEKDLHKPSVDLPESRMCRSMHIFGGILLARFLHADALSQDDA